MHCDRGGGHACGAGGRRGRQAGRRAARRACRPTDAFSRLPPRHYLRRPPWSVEEVAKRDAIRALRGVRTFRGDDTLFVTMTRKSRAELKLNLPDKESN